MDQNQNQRLPRDERLFAEDGTPLSPVENDSPVIQNAPDARPVSSDNDGIFYRVKQPRTVEPGTVPVDEVSVILGLAAIFGAFVMPLIAYVCGIIGIVRSARNRNTMRTRAAVVLSIVGILLGLLLTVVNALEIFRTVIEFMREASETGFIR